MKLLLIKKITCKMQGVINAQWIVHTLYFVSSDVYYLHEIPSMCTQCMCVSPVPNSNRREVSVTEMYSLFKRWLEAAVAPLPSPLLSSFSKLVIGMSSYVDPVHSATCSTGK